MQPIVSNASFFQTPRNDTLATTRFEYLQLPAKMVIHTVHMHFLEGGNAAKLRRELSNLVASDGKLSKAGHVRDLQ